MAPLDSFDDEEDDDAAVFVVLPDAGFEFEFDPPFGLAEDVEAEIPLLVLTPAEFVALGTVPVCNPT
jgi:hypothetical protein